MTRADELLRETIHEFAGQVRGVDNLAGLAMKRGRAMRARRRLATTAGVLAVVAAIAVPFIVFQDKGNQLPPLSEGISEREPVRLEAGWVVSGVDDWVFDRRKNGYVKLTPSGTDPQVYPAPAGDLAAIVDRAEGERGYTVEFVRTDGSGPSKKVEIAGAGGQFQWAPQGGRMLTKIVADRREADFGMGFAVIDAASGDVRKHWIDVTKYDCSQCRFVWSRDGREVAMALADRRGGESHEYVSGIQFFDASTGAPTRSLPVKAMFSSPFSWSPDGRYVIAQPDALKPQFRLIDIRTGETKPFPHDAVWASNERLLAATSKILTLYPSGTVVEENPLVGAFANAGRVTLGPP